MANPSHCTACGKRTSKGTWFFTAFLCSPCLRAAESKVGLD